MRFFFATFHSDLTYRLGWALVHSLWIGAIVAVVFTFVMSALNRRSAASRYLAGCGALAIFLAFAGCTFLISTPTAQPTSPAAVASANASPKQPVAATSVTSVGSGAAGHRVSADAPKLLARVSWSIEPILPWIVLLWIVGVCAIALRQLIGLVAAERLMRLAIRAPDSVLVALAERLARKLGIKQPVRLLESALVRVPTVIGWLQPVILLPVGFATGLAPAQVECILVHELGHIRRYDYLINLLQSLVEAVLFYHPATWYISRRIRLERENCCDDLVLAFGANRYDYAESLLQLARQSTARIELARFGMSAAGKPSELRARIARVVGAQQEVSRSARSWPVGIVLGVVMLALSSLWMASSVQATDPLSPNIVPAQASISPQPTQERADAWSQPLNGLRTRLSIQSSRFAAGRPIVTKLEVRNSGNQARSFYKPIEPLNSSLIVRDEHGRNVPYMRASVGAFMHLVTVEPQKNNEGEPFDLTQWFYLRRPGTYTAAWPGQKQPFPGETDAPLPATPVVRFEIIADAAGAADGNPYGRLLPLVRADWYLWADSIEPEKLHPGSNRREATGISFNFGYRTASEKDTINSGHGHIRLWLTNEPAAEQALAESDLPPSEYLGKIARWYVYINISPQALEAWPKAKEDIAHALGTTEK